jgi:hypothetical protein
MKRDTPFPFVLEELLPIRPVTKKMFGFTYVYLDEKLLLCLRDSDKQPGTNGVWLFTYTEHLESLRQEFPTVPRRCFWKSKQNAWVVLHSRLEDFEECAFTACGLILKGDPRIGRVTRRALQQQSVSPRAVKRTTKLFREADM